MKRFLFLFFSLIVVFSLNLSVMAAEGEAEQGSTEVIVPDVHIENIIDTGEDLGEYLGTSVYSLNPITPSKASGLKAVMLDFVGDWDSIVVEHSYQSTNGNINYVREIQLDYPWLCACGLLVVMIYCLFRLGGSILCRK